METSCSALLEFEKKILVQCFENDQLAIFSKGTCYYSILSSLLSAFSANESLVIVVNANDSEVEFLTSNMQQFSCQKEPIELNSKVSASERNKKYVEGGLFFITSRILIVDMLKKNIPVELINGLIVLNAEKIAQTSVESFIIAEFLKCNTAGFVKAFSDNPVSFSFGCSNIEKIMKTLKLSKITLYPRYHHLIANGLSNMFKSSEVFEVEVDFDQNTKICHDSLMDLLSACIIELTKFLKYQEDIKIEEILSNQSKAVLDMIAIRNQPLSTKKLFKDIRDDIKLIKRLFFDLIYKDSFAFYSKIESFVGRKSNFTRNTGWIFLESFNTLYKSSKARLFTSQKKADKSIEQCFEPKISSKWLSLLQILQDINKENISKPDINTDSKNRIALLFSSHESFEQYVNLTEVESLMDYFKIYAQLQKFKDFSEKYNTDEIINDSKKKKIQSFKDLPPELEVHPFIVKQKDSTQLHTFLNEINPKTIVIFEPSLSTVRLSEMFSVHSEERSWPISIYLMFYKDSIEHIAYLKDIAREKVSFEQLIQSRSGLVLTTERNMLLNPVEDSVVNSNENQNCQRDKIPSIIVDMREFRSDLPGYLHQKGMRIEPVTLEVADYVLTPQISIERKTINDFIQSVNSGRLYNQCVALDSFCDKPLLLIELGSDQSSFFSSFAIQDLKVVFSNIILLILHFPQINIIWSPSVYFTSEIFNHLKSNQLQPSIDMILSSEMDLDKNDSIARINSKKFIAKLPGIDSRSLKQIELENLSLTKLVNFSSNDLTSLIANVENSRKLYNLISKDLSKELSQL